MGERGGVEEKFSIWHFRLKKVKKHTFLRIAAMPQKCQTIFRKIHNWGRASRVKEQSDWQSSKSARIADAMPWHYTPIKCRAPIANDQFLLHNAPPSKDSQQATVRRAKSPINQQL